MPGCSTPVPYAAFEEKRKCYKHELEEKSKLAQAQVNKSKLPPALKPLNERKSKLHPPHYGKDMQSLKRKRGPSGRNIDSVKALQPVAKRPLFTQPAGTGSRHVVGPQADLQTHERHQHAQPSKVVAPGSEHSELSQSLLLSPRQSRSHQALQVIASRTKSSDTITDGTSIG